VGNSACGLTEVHSGDRGKLNKGKFDHNETAKIANYITSTTAYICQNGVNIEVGSDFKKYKNALVHQPERGPVMPNFDWERHDFTAKTAFWIIGRNEDGEIVHTQAVRILDLGDDCLAAYVRKNFAEFTPSGWLFDKKKSSYLPAVGSKKISGTVCCHGEFWLKGGSEGFRGKGLAILTARLGMITSLLKWSPDYLFSFMTSNSICKGLAARTGFMHTEQVNRFWFLPGHEESVEAWTVWVSYEDMLHHLDIKPQLLSQQLNSFKAGQKAKEVA